MSKWNQTDSELSEKLHGPELFRSSVPNASDTETPVCLSEYQEKFNDLKSFVEQLSTPSKNQRELEFQIQQLKVSKYF